MNIYLFSGLGADERIFQNLKPISGYTYVPVPFVHPASANSLSEYARLMIDTHKFQTPCIFAGVSIGGMVAQEIAQIVKPEKLILISTLQFANEKPKLFKWANTKFVKSLLNKSVLWALATVGDKFTIKSPEGRKLFYQMLHDADPSFMKFGAGAVLSWQSPVVQCPVIRMHGNNDRIFPLSRIKDKNCQIIHEGNHFMIYDKGAEISIVLKKMLAPIINPVDR